MTREAWEAAHPNMSFLFKMVPGLSALNFCPDVMHTMHLGSYQYFLGSVLEYLVFHMMTGRPEENVATIWQKLLQSYKVFHIDVVFSIIVGHKSASCRVLLYSASYRSQSITPKGGRHDATVLYVEAVDVQEEQRLSMLKRQSC